VLFVRVAVAVTVLNSTLLPYLVPLLVAPLAVGAVAAWLSVRRGGAGGAPPQAPTNPLQLTAALQMAAAFQLVLFVLEGVNRRFGNTGLLASAFALGLTDVDALTASMTNRVADGLAAEVGVVAIATGILSNSLTKLGIALAIGRGRFRMLTAIGLVAMTLAGLAAVIVLT
jgi:uncharacterized membrane protein (DUF4010 family)